MSILFSKSCEYGIQATLYLSRDYGNKPMYLRDLSDTLYIPYHFLSKIMRTLSREGIVTSAKGQTGGFSLAVSPDQLTLLDIVHAIDGNDFLSRCVLGFPKCGEGNPCPAHETWVQAKEIILNMLKKNINELSKELEPKLDLIEQLIEKCCQNPNCHKDKNRVDLNTCCE